MSKSPTPLVYGLLPGVSLEDESELIEKGHSIHRFDNLGMCDIILGPQCYNTEGELSKKQLDVLTKSTRALVRAKKKAERDLAKKEREAKKK